MTDPAHRVSLDTHLYYRGKLGYSTAFKINNTIYRYKFDELFLEDLISFAKIHQFDDRKTFKEEWKLWCESNEEFIEREENRLVSLGYKGDCKDKMFKSSRYYFRKKSFNSTY